MKNNQLYPLINFVKLIIESITLLLEFSCDINFSSKGSLRLETMPLFIKFYLYVSTVVGVNSQ